jgi:hypothetical protein
MRMKDDQISALEKDVFYYKHKRQELESHVKEIVQAGDATLSQAAAQEAELESLRNANRALVMELGNTKAYLHQQLSASPGPTASGGNDAGFAEQQAHAIRISRSQMQQQLELGRLRPLSREEALQRNRKQSFR